MAADLRSPLLVLAALSRRLAGGGPPPPWSPPSMPELIACIDAALAERRRR